MDNNKKEINIPLIIGGLVLVIIIGGGITFAITNGNKDEDNNTGTEQTDNNQNIEDETSLTTDESGEPVVENDADLNPTEDDVTTTPNVPEVPTDTPDTTTSTKYENGVYSATGTYTSPAGTEQVAVTLTVDNDAITVVTVTPMASNPTSKMKQTEFSKGISSKIVGKKLDEVVYPGNVNGSSLTGNGFVEAVNAIKVDAAV